MRCVEGVSTHCASYLAGFTNVEDLFVSRTLKFPNAKNAQDGKSGSAILSRLHVTKSSNDSFTGSG